MEHATPSTRSDAFKANTVEDESALCGDRETVVDAAERFGLERAIRYNRAFVR
jgi:hypothetical protein